MKLISFCSSSGGGVARRGSEAGESLPSLTSKRRVAFSPTDRATFAAVAKEMGEIRQAEAGGGLDGWL